MNLDLVYKKRVAIEDLDGLVNDLTAIAGEQWVSTEEADLVAYSKDSQLISHRWIMERKLPGLPHVIVWPENEEQVSKILKLAFDRKIPVIPYAEGSGCVGAAIPVHGGITVDTKRLNKVIEVDEKDLTVTVQAGINGKALERALQQKGYLVGHVPQSFHTATVGGWIAHRGAGQFSTKYGKIEDIMLSLRVVLPDGSIVDTKLASDGPQLERLFLGSEGTLGIITQATLKMWPWPEKQAGVGIAFDDVEHAIETVRLVLRQQVYPAVVRIYDQDETARHFYMESKAKGKVMIVFVCEGMTKLVDLELATVRAEAEKQGGIDCGMDPVDHWFETRFNVKETSIWTPRDAIIDTIEVSCMWKDAPALYRNVIAAMKKVPGMAIITGHASHSYPQGACFYFTFVGVGTGKMSPEAFYNEAWNAGITATLKSNGSISHHHGVGLIRARFMGEEHGFLLEIMKRIKNAIDTGNIMNPGKLYEAIERGK